jgi:nucleoid DNA-binding protein
MLTKQDLAYEIEHRIGVKPQMTKNIMNCMAEIALEEIKAGEDFVVPGIVRITFNYRKAFKKGERFKKGETVVGFGGMEQVKEEDSKATKETMKLKANIMPLIKKALPNKGTAGFKNVVSRKAK